ncbi:hypothetical protein CA12_23090 [Alienimonas californiensis]|uniref:Uncharacterized protein n=1 Tax=Alienimonas californiensis TaxID=2527989 RepID=A0A517PA12_9PLAN|nr:hypothetical protein CA12_23090 [Alienimonas californiensis]
MSEDAFLSATVAWLSLAGLGAILLLVATAWLF